MALAANIRKKSYQVVVIIGDGESNEGSIWEAALSASKHKLSNLLVLVDNNKLQSYGPTSEVLDMAPLKNKWQSFGFGVREVDGHDINALELLFNQVPFSKNKPSVIICHTIKGKGISFAEGETSWHHKSGLKQADFDLLYECLN